MRSSSAFFSFSWRNFSAFKFFSICPRSACRPASNCIVLCSMLAFHLYMSRSSLACMCPFSASSNTLSSTHMLSMSARTAATNLSVPSRAPSSPCNELQLAWISEHRSENFFTLASSACMAQACYFRPRDKIPLRAIGAAAADVAARPLDRTRGRSRRGVY